MADIHVITNSNIDNSPNNVILSSRNTTPTTPFHTFNTGPYPTILLSLQLLGDSNFVTGYSYRVELNGLNFGAGGGFNQLATASAGTEFVPTGTGYLIPANSTLKIYAYNSTASGSNGTLSIYGVFDIQS